MWVFVGVCMDGGPFAIGGIDVWATDWHRQPGQFAAVRDPAYGQPFRFAVYRVRHGRRSVGFAAGEFSNCVWGFFVTRRTKTRLAKLRGSTR